MHVTILGILLIGLIALSSGCKPLNWEHWSMEKILFNQDIVVYGKEIERVPGEHGFKNANFQVYCVLKNDNASLPISEFITIEEVDPVTSCSGTDIPPNEDILLGLRRQPSGNFRWHEPNVTPDGAEFAVNISILIRASKVCGLQNTVQPEGRPEDAEPSCTAIPVSETSDVGCVRDRTRSDSDNAAFSLTPSIMLSVFACLFLLMNLLLQ